MTTDDVEKYAEQVRAVLAGAPATVAELRQKTGLSERIVRLALDRLVLVRGTVEHGSNYRAGHRGAVPRLYSLKVSA